MKSPLAVVQTGSANIASVVAAFARAGFDATITRDPDVVQSADRVVLPGVGAFGDVMARMIEAGVSDAIVERCASGKPLLAICLGLQVLAEGSEESAGISGLRVIRSKAKRFPAGITVPQLGWNRVIADASDGLVRDGHAYFANSYYIDTVDADWTPSWSVHGVRFIAAIERGAQLACQFHPELSSAWGAALIDRWIARMLTRRVIPCLDTQDGRVVKGVQFRGLRDAGSPVELAERYQVDGADELVVLDISATIENRAHTYATIRDIRRALAIPLTVGGGVRSVDDAARLLDAGADKVAVNTAAFVSPALLTQLATRFGSQCIVLSVDASASEGGWQVAVRAGTDMTSRDVVAWAIEGEWRGAGEILLTSVDRDGTQSGYDLGLVRAVSGSVSVPVVASGGARNASDLTAALSAGADAVLAASIFHDGLTSVGDIKAALASAGIPIRT